MGPMDEGGVGEMGWQRLCRRRDLVSFTFVPFFLLLLPFLRPFLEIRVKGRSEGWSPLWAGVEEGSGGRKTARGAPLRRRSSRIKIAVIVRITLYLFIRQSIDGEGKGCEGGDLCFWGCVFVFRLTKKRDGR